MNLKENNNVYLQELSPIDLAGLKAKQSSLKAKQSLLVDQMLSTGKLAIMNLPLIKFIKPKGFSKRRNIVSKFNLPSSFFSFLLPLLLNRTIFRHNNFISRLVTTMVARRIGKNVGLKVATWLCQIIKR